MKVKSKPIYSYLTPAIFNKIMTIKTSNEIWDFLKQQYEEDENIKGNQVMNWIQAFELQKMKEL